MIVLSPKLESAKEISVNKTAQARYFGPFGNMPQKVYDALGDGHAKAGTLHLIGAGSFLPGKGVKKSLLKLLAHADAVIAAAAAVMPQTCKNERREIFFII